MLIVYFPKPQGAAAERMKERLWSCRVADLCSRVTPEGQQVEGFFFSLLVNFAFLWHTYKGTLAALRKWWNYSPA